MIRHDDNHFIQLKIKTNLIKKVKVIALGIEYLYTIKGPIIRQNCPILPPSESTQCIYLINLI